MQALARLPFQQVQHVIPGSTILYRIYVGETGAFF